MVTERTDAVIQATRLSTYFHHAVHNAAAQSRLDADGATLHYLATLLCSYARSEKVFDYADQRLQLRPLARLYGEALEARNPGERRLWLQRLGDLALFVGGLFAGHLNRHFQDLDYCVAMGGNAYSCLQDSAERRDQTAQALVFGELSTQFDRCIEVVAIATGRQEPTGQS